MSHRPKFTATLKYMQVRCCVPSSRACQVAWVKTRVLSTNQQAPDASSTQREAAHHSQHGRFRVYDLIQLYHATRNVRLGYAMGSLLPFRPNARIPEPPLSWWNGPGPDSQCRCRSANRSRCVASSGAGPRARRPVPRGFGPPLTLPMRRGLLPTLPHGVLGCITATSLVTHSTSGAGLRNCLG